MAWDSKFGRVTTERGTLGEDERVVIFRSKDVLLPDLLVAYHALAMSRGAGMEHMKVIAHLHQDIVEWQQQNPDKVKIPDTLPGQIQIP